VALLSDHPPSVLIVDDDPAIRDALRFALSLEGFDVHAYRSGAELLADHDLPRAGCVVVDDRMPCMDGFELLGHLQARASPLPTILLTSHATDRLYARAAAAGVSVVLEKPFLDAALATSILTILGDE
jgi:FixJ family two-component response regulator